MYLDTHNLYGWAMSQKLPVNSFKWKTNVSRFDEDIIKNYDEKSKKGYILEVDIEYAKYLQDLHSDLSFLSGSMKVNKSNKLVDYLYHKKLCCSNKIFKISIRSWIRFKKKYTE